MPANATLEQRLKWHLAHAKHCDCRPIPPSILGELKKRGIAPPVPASHSARGKPARRQR